MLNFTYLIVIGTALVFTITGVTAPAPVVVGIAAGIGAVGSILLDKYGYQIPFSVSCRVQGECCDDAAITRNWTGLHHDLTTKLYGQHLVEQQMLMHIREHFEDQNPRRPLVLSFHGSTGVGKNFVSELIARNLFARGTNSQFFHYFSSTVNFAHPNRVTQYAEELKGWLLSNTSNCARNVFVFDEIDKMDARLLETLGPFLDYMQAVQGVDFRRTTFIFLSNLGASNLNLHVFESWREGKRREAITYRELEDVLINAAYDHQGDSTTDAPSHRLGLSDSFLVSRSLISAYVPFLPLERVHVRFCARDELKRIQCWHKLAEKEQDRLLNLIADYFRYEPDDTPRYSALGCKSIESYVRQALIDDEYLGRTCIK